MSAPTTHKRKRGKPQDQARQPKPDMDPVELMKAMGGNGWFNPESNDMIRWLLKLSDERRIPRPIFHMYAWMKWHTLTVDNRQPYANRKGVMLYLKDMAADLGIEISNLRAHWRLGVQLGLWRNGVDEDGEKTEGLYLCAKIATVAVPVDPKNTEQVCTNLRAKFLEQFRPYIRQKLAELPDPVFADFAARWSRLETVEDSAHADLLATVRMVMGQDKDTLLREIGIEKKRLGAKKKETEEELAEAVNRQARIDDLVPHVQRYVQTLAASVQTPKFTLYEGGNDVSTKSPKNGDSALSLVELPASGENGANASLLGLENLDKPLESLCSIQASGHDGNSEPLNPLPKRERGSYTRPKTAARSDQKPETTAAALWSEVEEKAVHDAVQSAWGSPLLPGDTVPGQLLQIASRLKAPTRVLCMWIHYFGQVKREKGYAIESPSLFVHAAPRGLPPWIRGNRTVVEEAMLEKEREQAANLANNVAQLFGLIPDWQKWVPGGADISPEIDSHVDGVIAIAQQLGCRTVQQFALNAIVKLQDHNPMAKAPGRSAGAPAGPRVLAVVFDLAKEFGRESKSKGAR
jgi:hypothetical protein